MPCWQRVAREETGIALLLVLLGSLVFVALGAFLLMSVDRNTDSRAAFTRGVTGFNSAEAGVHIGAGAVKNALLNWTLPSNCTAGGTSFTINGRTVTYTLSVPTGSPWNGVAGSCAETTQPVTEAAGTTFAGLKGQAYEYNLSSSAVNSQGFTEATVNSQFQAHSLPVFQFAAFYLGDLEVLPQLNAVFAGRLHSNADIYLDTGGTCGSPTTNGLNILGPITIVGSGKPGTAPLNRGRKDDTTLNRNNVYISLVPTPPPAAANMQVLGTNAAGSMSCATVNTRQIGQAEINTFNTSNPQITTNIQSISGPSQVGMLCVPWITGCPATGGGYWQNANLRIALDTTQVKTINGTSPCPFSVNAPCLYPVEVLNADGTVNGGLTTSLITFMQANPGAITYSDVPKSGLAWDCTTYRRNTCDSAVYVTGSNYGPSPSNPAYATAFPTAGAHGCGVGVNRNANTRQVITATNYCNDYRYGGFFDWREEKPILMLNIDWMALEEYNDRTGNVFFDPTTTTNGGLVIFLTVKDTAWPGPTEGLKASNYGVRIFDAARARRNLTDAGVAFATDRAMYLVGNVNCPVPTWNGASTVPAPCGDGAWAPPFSGSYKQKPVSIAADSMNTLSCAWIQPAACGNFTLGADNWVGPNFGVGTIYPLDDHSTTCIGGIYTFGCLSNPTIINAALFAGTDQTWCPSNHNGNACDNGDSNFTYYSGGLENYLRMAEDWSYAQPIQNLWYQGSFVSSGTPNHTCFAYITQLVAVANDPLWTCTLNAQQGFSGFGAVRRNAPARRFFYDRSFDNTSYLPPLTPRFVYLQLVFFTQNFK